VRWRLSGGRGGYKVAEREKINCNSHAEKAPDEVRRKGLGHSILWERRESNQAEAKLQMKKRGRAKGVRWQSF